jgi:hypothetical protein
MSKKTSNFKEEWTLELAISANRGWVACLTVFNGELYRFEEDLRSDNILYL